MKRWLFARLSLPDAPELGPIELSSRHQVINPPRGWLLVYATRPGYEGHLHVADYQALLTHARTAGLAEALPMLERGHQRMTRTGDMGAPFGLRSVVIELDKREWPHLRRAWTGLSRR